MFGQAIVEQLRNDHENDTNPHIIVGTRFDDNDLPRGAKTFIDVLFIIYYISQIILPTLLKCISIVMLSFMICTIRQLKKQNLHLKF